MPDEEEIKKIMEKARKAASGGKGYPKGKSPVQKKDPSAAPHKEEKPPPPPPDPLTLALKSSIDRLTDVVGKLEAQVTNTETKTGVVNTGGEETGKTEGATQEELTPEQELAMLQEAQQRGQEAGQGQVPAGPGNPLYIYLLGKTLDTVGKVLPAALQRGAGKEEGGSFSQVAEALVLEWLKKSFAGGGGGGGGDQNISVEAMKTMSNFQGMLLGSFFNTIKNLPKPMAEKIIEGAIETPGGIQEPIK